jgi:hypothetical protein
LGQLRLRDIWQVDQQPVHLCAPLAGAQSLRTVQLPARCSNAQVVRLQHHEAEVMVHCRLDSETANGTGESLYVKDYKY